MDMCLNACSALGEGIAQYIFVAVAVAWGAWTRRQLAQQKMETERYKAMSLKPPAPIPVVHFQGAAEGVQLASLFPPKPSGYNPDYEAEIVGSTSPETPTSKREPPNV